MFACNDQKYVYFHEKDTDQLVRHEYTSGGILTSGTKITINKGAIATCVDSSKGLIFVYAPANGNGLALSVGDYRADGPHRQLDHLLLELVPHRALAQRVHLLLSSVGRDRRQRGVHRGLTLQRGEGLVCGGHVPNEHGHRHGPVREGAAGRASRSPRRPIRRGRASSFEDRCCVPRCARATTIGRCRYCPCAPVRRFEPPNALSRAAGRVAALSLRVVPAPASAEQAPLVPRASAPLLAVAREAQTSAGGRGRGDSAVNATETRTAARARGGC
jgi:hypothetical protein